MAILVNSQTAQKMSKMNIPEIKISVCLKSKPNPDEIIIRSSQDCYNVFKSVFDADTFLWKEEFIMLCLNRQNKVVGFYKVSSGGIDATIVDPKVVFTVALNCCASNIIIAHNHPSGALKPSQPDIEMTKRLKKAGEVLGINILDHLILANEGFYSFADNNTI